MSCRLNRQALAAVIITGVIAIAGCMKEEKPPARDQFRVLKTRLNAVQEAVKSGDRAAIDSLLVSELKNEPEGADSLLSFVQGDSPDFSLEVFTDYEIFYTHTAARIDCYLINADTTVRRPATFTFELSDGQWVLKRWEPGQREDTATAQ
jgi:hypothetical protein